MPDNVSGKIYPVKIIALLAALLGAFVQIQASLMQQGSYAGIRINLADPILPIAGLAIFVSLLLKRSRWPQWSVPLCWGFIAALTGIMVFVLFNGYAANGEWTTWALVNKFTGWFILLAYFALGGWLATNHSEQTLPAFIKSFVYLACILAYVFTIRAYFLHAIGDEWRLLYKSQVAGLSGNRNAFAFLFFAALCITSLIKKDAARFFIPPYVTLALWAITPFFILYNGSRAGFVLIILLLVFLTATHFRFYAKRVIPIILLSCVILSVTVGNDINDIFIKQQKERGEAIIQLAQTDMKNADDLKKITKKRTSEYMRFRVFRDAMDLWKTSPITGSGLGTFLHSQYEKYDPETTIIDIIDSTPLWLLTEMGGIGLLCFLAFYVMVLYSLWRYRRENPDTLHGQFAGAVILIMIGFGMMSLLHELLYTRFLWLFMGLALGLPAQKASSRIKAETTDISPISDT